MRCKVIVTCFTPRKQRQHAKYPYHRQDLPNAQAVVEMLKAVIAADRGDADLIIVNNQVGFESGDRFLNSLPCIVEHRENRGGPIAGYEYAFRRHRDKYTHWLFTEDDIVITERSQILQDRFTALQPACGFLALAGFYDREPQHAHGAIGFTSREVLGRLLDSGGGRFPHPDADTWDQRDMEIDGEVAFSQGILNLGLSIVPYGDNCRWHISNGCLPYYDFTHE